MTDDRPRLSVLDGILLIVGIIIGTSVLRVPASLAQQTTGPAQLFVVIALGGALAACGAYCYAQLARRYPERGGEYAYLHHSFGETVSFLFAWSRVTVVQTGSIAATAFVFGDYMTKLANLGPGSVVWYAAFAVLGLTVLNARGLQLGRVAQNCLTAAKVLGLLAIVGAAFLAPAVPAAAAPAAAAPDSAPAFGLAMVFVLYAFGGWNEASYLAGDVRRGARDVALVLFASLAAVTLGYLVIHAAYLRALGFEGLRASSIPAADVIGRSFGSAGAPAVAAIAAVAAIIALGTANATIFTGSRALQALGGQHRSLAWLGRADARRATPVAAFVLQGAVALAIVLAAGILGEGGRKGFEVAVEYTAPAFWGFMTLIGVGALLRLARVAAERTPAFALSALVFVGLDLYMLRSSVVYVGKGALLGLAVVAVGVPVYLVVSRLDARRAPAPEAAVVESAAVEASAGS